MRNPIASADQIYVIEKGEIVEWGTHDEQNYGTPVLNEHCSMLIEGDMIRYDMFLKHLACLLFWEHIRVQTYFTADTSCSIYQRQF